MISAKLLSLVVFTIQQVSLVLMIRQSQLQETAYLASTAVVSAECLKLFINLVLIMFRHEKKSVWSLKDALKLAVPALLYVVQNNLLFVALANLSVPVYQVTNQGKLLTTALCSRLMLHKKLSTTQYVSLILLACGVAIVQLSSSNEVDSDGTKGQNQVLGLAAIAVSCFTSGFAGVYFEKVLKSSQDVSVYLCNCQLAIWSILLGLAPIIHDWPIAEGGFFQGYNAVVVGVIVNQALTGLVVALVLKYADTILKGFATSISIVAATIFSVYLWKAHVDGRFLLGATLVIFAVFMYSKQPAVPKHGRRKFRLFAWRHRLVAAFFLATAFIINNMNVSFLLQRDALYSPPDRMLAPKNWKKPKLQGTQQAQWKGCLRFKCDENATRCDTMEPTKLVGPLPPCCVHIRRDMARAFDDAMSELGLDYFTAYGMLLGLVRSNRLIPWTIDNDYVVTKTTVSALQSMSPAIFERHGLKFLFDGFFRLCVTPSFAKGQLTARWNSTRGGWYPLVYPYADLFVADFHADQFVDELGCGDSAKIFFPSKRMPVYNGTFSVSVPRDSETVLKNVYGPDWRTPDPKKKQHGNTKCRGRSKADNNKPVSVRLIQDWKKRRGINTTVIYKPRKRRGVVSNGKEKATSTKANQSHGVNKSVDATVSVLVTQPISDPTLSSASLLETVRDALSSPKANVTVYVTDKQVAAVPKLLSEFSRALRDKKLRIILGTAFVYEDLLTWQVSDYPVWGISLLLDLVPHVQSLFRGNMTSMLLRLKQLASGSLTEEQMAAARKLEAEFVNALKDGRLRISIRTEYPYRIWARRYPGLFDDYTFAFLLDLAHQSGSDFTLFLRAGTRLLNGTAPHEQDYVTRMLQAEADRRNEKLRTCWTTLSESSDAKLSPPSNMLISTEEHAHRMSIVLRSLLPYKRMSAMEILDGFYCRGTLWEAKVMEGPPLFSSYRELEIPSKPRYSGSILPFINASEFRLPFWIDSTELVGPRMSGRTVDYQVTFAAPTMMRPVQDYVIQFMDQLLDVVKKDFVIPGSLFRAREQKAVILLLVSGNSMEAMVEHRAVLEKRYGDAVDQGLVRLQDAPATFNLSNLRQHGGSSPQRRYGRSKQNLDVAATLRAAAGISEFTLLLEDDTAFQPGFGAALKDVMEQANGIPTWSKAVFGFGYSGLLIHDSDLPVYEQLHAVMFDERPCDLMPIAKYIKTGQVRQVTSPTRFSNHKNSYLRHLGKISTLKENNGRAIW